MNTKGIIELGFLFGIVRETSLFILFQWQLTNNIIFFFKKLLIATEMENSFKYDMKNIVLWEQRSTGKNIQEEINCQPQGIGFCPYLFERVELEENASLWGHQSEDVTNYIVNCEQFGKASTKKKTFRYRQEVEREKCEDCKKENDFVNLHAP